MAQPLAKGGRYISDFDTFQKGLAPRKPAWVHRIRQRALARFTDLGFPTARRGNEKWKYTSVVPIANTDFQYPLHRDRPEVGASDLRALAPWGRSWTRLVFLNGRYSPALSTPPSRVTGARVANLARVLRSDGHMAKVHLSKHATFDDDAFVALNTAFLHDGAFVHVPRDTTLQRPIHLIYVTSEGPEPAVTYPRTLVVAEPHSRLTLIESYVSLSQARYFTNAVTEIALDEGAEVEHYRLLLDGPESFHVGTTRVRQDRDSTFSSGSFTRGAALARSDFHVLLDGPGTSCNLNGLYMTSGTQHIDNYLNIDHAKPHTTSRLYYKGILDGRSKAVFGGTVLVRRDAQKANAHQSDKNLVLSKDAEVDSKPSLLIYADDVMCGHGATAGYIDDDAVLYMRSRGLDLETASRLLIHGFASEIIDTVQLEPVRAFLDKLFLGSLPDFRLGGRL